MMQAAIFLDRDGVINPDPGYINNPAALNLYPFTAQAVRNFNCLGYKVIVVTNQSGIARGLVTIDQMNAIHQKLIDDLAAQKAIIDKIYFSPYHIDGYVPPYNINHEDRKPDIGMFKKACRDFALDPSTSFMIGDRRSDMIFAHMANLTSILVLTGDGKKDLLSEGLLDSEFAPDYAAQDLLAASFLIKMLVKD
jgi:D-glycero-D-manno-heptose 1,7-bisphosphate phosphatase